MRYGIFRAAVIPLVAAFSLLLWSSNVMATHLEDLGPDGVPGTGDERPLPHATCRIWSPAAVPAADYSLNTGLIRVDPNQTIADTGGLTSHVNTAADPLTIATVYENTGCSGLPCGVTYWNPATDDFKCYGYSGGFMSGISLHTTAPTRVVDPDGTPGTGDETTFSPGDTWLFKSSGRSVTVQFVGSDNFRSYNRTSGGGISAFGGAVDQATGNVWFVEPSGKVSLLDPTTDTAREWTIGGVPHYVAVDSAGNAYVAGSGQRITRINPSLAIGNVTRWPLPDGGGFLAGFFFGNPDGITIDQDGNVWFSEHSGDEVGRLDPTTDKICEFTKPPISQPQNIASSGTGATLQTFFTEAAGRSVSIVTQVEADLMPVANRDCAISVSVETVDEVARDLSVEDHIKRPSRLPVVPVTVDLEGADGVPGSGATLTAGPDGITGTADDEVIPGLLRFPFVSAFPAIGGMTIPTGMTQVVAANTVYGSFIGSDQMFECKSDAIIAAPDEADVCDPRTQGFWKRICTKDHPEFNGTDRTDLIGLVDVTAVGPNACAVYDQLKKPTKCQLADRQRIALEFNLQSGFLESTCPLSDGSTVGDAVTQIDADLATDTKASCTAANDLADSINTGEVIVVASLVPSLDRKVSPALNGGASPIMLAKASGSHPSSKIRGDLLALLSVAEAVADLSSGEGDVSVDGSTDPADMPMCGVVE